MFNFSPTFDDLIHTLVVAGIPVSLGWAWKTQSSITTLLTRDENDKEWRTDIKSQLVRLEDKLDGIRHQQGASDDTRDTQYRATRDAGVRASHADLSSNKDR